MSFESRWYHADHDRGEYSCELCDVTLFDEANLQNHFQGKPHLKLAQRHGEHRVRTAGDEAESSVTGRHFYELPSEFEDRVRRAKRRTAADPEEEDFGRRSRQRLDRCRKDPSWLVCEPCGVYTKSGPTMMCHKAGKTHQQRTKEIRPFECTLCNVVVSSQETLRTHFQGSKHMKREQASMEAKGSISAPSSPEAYELEAIQELREMVTRLNLENSNLKRDIKTLLEFKATCIRNHHGVNDAGPVKREKAEAASICEDVIVLD